MPQFTTVACEHTATATLLCCVVFFCCISLRFQVCLRTGIFWCCYWCCRGKKQHTIRKEYASGGKSLAPKKNNNNNPETLLDFFSFPPKMWASMQPIQVGHAFTISHSTSVLIQLNCGALNMSNWKCEHTWMGKWAFALALSRSRSSCCWPAKKQDKRGTKKIEREEFCLSKTHTHTQAHTSASTK